MKATLWKLIHKWRDATTTESAWIARDQIDIELDKIELAARQEPVGSVTVSPWRGLENIEWQQSADIPEGTHMLYLAAGAQVRKPLTDEQIYSITGVEDRDEMMHRMARNIARAIEQAHGIKEQP